MKPSRPYHAVTAAHREPGGLHRLDFFVSRIASWKGDRRQVRVLDVGCGQGDAALPLAHLGYQVTGIDTDRVAIERAKERAKDLRVDAQFIETSLSQFSERDFDVVILHQALNVSDDAGVALKAAHTHCAPDGMLLVTAQGSRRMQDLLYASGWKIQNQMSATGGLQWAFRISPHALKRGSRAFYMMDAADRWLASHMPCRYHEQFMELRPFDPSKTRVMHIVTGLYSGGAEHVVRQLVTKLPSYGYAVHVVALQSGPLEPLFREEGIELTVLPRCPSPTWLFSFCDLWRVMKRERPTIVHTHLFGADIIGRLVAYMQRVPVVVITEHNINLDYSRFKSFLKGLLHRWTTAFIAVSDGVKTYLEERGVPSAKIYVIRNGIDLARVRPRPPGPFHDIPRLLIVGRLMMQKGHDTLLKALAHVSRPWILDIVGTGELEGELKALAERLGLASRVRWLGYRDDVPQLLADADLFCFPSRFEGLGLAFLEAVATGVPVIASDLPVFREIVDPDQVSLVPVDDVTAFAHAIDHVLKDPLPAVREAYESALSIHDRFSLSGMVDAYADVYRHLV